MTSGYRAVGDAPTGGYTHGPSATPFLPGPQALFEPGAAYAYWDSAMNQFGQVLTRLAGEPLDEYFRRRIADPIGMNPAAWQWGDFGPVEGLRVNGGAGNAGKHVQIAARELARFGHLLLNRGEWNGRRLISADWVRQATAVQVPASVTNAWTQSGIAGPGQYGFNWWCNAPGPDGQLTWPGAPADTFAASGHNNNRLFVIPSWDMVIVRLGLDQADRAWTDEAQREFLRLVGEALEFRSCSTNSSREIPTSGRPVVSADGGHPRCRGGVVGGHLRVRRAMGSRHLEHPPRAGPRRSVRARAPGLRLLDELGRLWNARWFGGGYERYHSSGQCDQPGPWTFASWFILRAQQEAGMFDRSRRTLEWLNTVQGGRTGAWFEEIPLIRSQAPTAGIIPWTSGDISPVAADRAHDPVFGRFRGRTPPRQVSASATASHP